MAAAALPLVGTRMIEFLIVTFGAWMLREPRRSMPLITAPGVLMAIQPVLTVSLVPAGTPVVAAVGYPVGVVVAARAAARALRRAALTCAAWWRRLWWRRLWC